MDLPLVAQRLPALSIAKRKETAAREFRIKCEEDVIEASGFEKAEGSETYSFEHDDLAAKFEIKRPISVSVDEDAIPDLKKALGKKRFESVFKTKHSVVAKGLKDLEKTDHDAWLAVQQVLTRKPGKIAVTIKNLETI